MSWDRTRRPIRAGLLLPGLLLLGGCSGQDLGLPTLASDRADDVSQLWLGAWVAALAVGVLVWGLIGYVIIRFRRRSDDEIPTQLRYHLPLEVLYTIAPVIMVSVFFFHTVQTNADVLAEPEATHRVLVLGQKWSWTFNYTGEEAVNGGDVYDVGTTAEPPTLWLPVDETVRFDLRSIDVVHAFWVPAFAFKLDVIPGRGYGEVDANPYNSFVLTPTRVGEFPGRCSELCGLYHSRMLFTVKVVSREEYDAHLRELQAIGQTGVVLGGQASDKIAGLEEGGEQ